MFGPIFTTAYNGYYICLLISSAEHSAGLDGLILQILQAVTAGFAEVLFG